MDGDGENELVILPIEVIKVISPYVFNVTGIYEPVTVWRILDEHPTSHLWLSISFHDKRIGQSPAFVLNLHWRQIINVPICRDFNETGIRTMNQRLHPVFCLFAVIYFGPRIPGSQIVCLAVMMRHAMIIFDTVVQK